MVATTPVLGAAERALWVGVEGCELEDGWPSAWSSVAEKGGALDVFVAIGVVGMIVRCVQDATCAYCIRVL